MRKFFKQFRPLLVFGVSSYFTLFAGTLEGKIKIYDYSEKENKKVDNSDYSDAVVYFTTLKDEEKKNEVSLEQIDKKFGKRVLAITQGQSVKFINKDKFFHNVWSTSKTRSFDLGTFKAPNHKSVQFDKPGLVKVFCNIHPQMISSILVLKNSKYSVTDKKGNYKITNIPSGEHVVRIWVEGQSPKKVTVKINKNQKKVMNFEVVRKKRTGRHLNKHGKRYEKY